MTEEQKDIIFMQVIKAERRLLTAARDYGDNDYRHFIENSAAVYYTLFQIVKDLDLESEYSDWRLNGEE